MPKTSRTFVLFGLDAKDVVSRGRLIATTTAPDFAAAARQLGGELIDGDATIYGVDAFTMIGNGEVRIFEPGPCAAEVLAKAVASDSHADFGREADALERMSGYLHGERLGFVLCTAPEAPAI